MLRLIKSSYLDEEKLSKIIPFTEEKLDNFDFSKVVVRKPWGNEYLAFTGGKISFWILSLKKDALTSMHCHVNKKTILMVLSGKTQCSTLNETFILEEGDGLVLEKRVFHSTKAISDKGAIVMEIETPIQKTDLVRLQDVYGRESKGYEPEKEMCFDLSEYERVYFHFDEKEEFKKIGNMNLCIQNLENIPQLQNYFSLCKNSVIIILNGELYDKKNQKTLLRGDCFEINNLDKINDFEIKDSVKILNLTKNIMDFD